LKLYEGRNEIKKNCEVVSVNRTSKTEVEFEWKDLSFNSEDSACYYIHVF